MKFNKTELPGVILIEPDVYKDPRGFFLETWQEKKYREGGIDYQFVQDNYSKSVKGTLRGLHAQKAKPQGKLVRVVKGEVFDVAVDITPDSPTFKRWVGVTLSADKFNQFFVPPGFAHGFCVLSDEAEFEYKCTDFYDPSDEITIRWDDPELGVDWPVTKPLLSDRDSKAPLLSEIIVWI